MPVENPDEIRKILEGARTVAVVGLSKKPERDSYRVAEYLKHKGYKIIPINPAYAGEEILGERVKASIEEVDEKVDIMDVFRKSEAVPEIAEAAIKKKIPVVWLQLGIVHEEAARKMEQAGIKVVMDRCMKIEHGKLLG